jgi:cytoplasmic iron level regulating protein YaaA (DUF328/UPF0246 family)
MLLVLSPAKSLDYQRPLPPGLARRATAPAFVAQAAELIAQLRTLSPPQVAQLMDLSDELAALNVARYGAWQPAHDAHNSRPAALAFNGDVYGGLDARSLGLPDLAWAQQHLVILSGLYGVLRPLDRLQPYRLEMGTRLANARGRDLYAFWGETVTAWLAERLAADRHPLLVNLASQEYFKVVDRAALAAPGVRVVDCVFEEWRGGAWRIVALHAKRARGLMARWAIAQRARSLRALEGFDAEGYAFDAAASAPARLVFRRRSAG